jgi:exosome complex exonuclease DIS3/RRP44
MLGSKSFSKKTRSGKVLKVVKEVYLRDDICCGSELCEECKQSAAKLQKEGEYFVVDTNVVLQQMDLLERLSSKWNVVVLQTVLSELQNKHPHHYARLRKLCSDETSHFYVFSNEVFRYLAKFSELRILQRNLYWKW